MISLLENSDSLIPRSAAGHIPRMLTIGDDQDSLDELDRLLTTLDVKPVGRVMIHNPKISPGTFISTGKIQAAQESIEKCAADAVVLDFELSPNQLANLEKELKRPIIDRPGVILEIFSSHARTKEAKTQVALAKLEYLLPRLKHFWTHFERQRGGAVLARGMGEKQIEIDRRLVKKQMSILRSRLAGVERERAVQRAGRKDVLKVAIVGYTNAGKSTLLNAMTHSHVRAEDKLFATLDASVRTLDPGSHPPIVAIDTVGFISRLPHSLVASFRSTLEELHEADLLVHVVDASAAQARAQMETTESVLHELEVDTKPRMTVLNKIDQLPQPGGRNQAKLLFPGAILISALDTNDVARLRDQILSHFRKSLEVWEIVVPYSESRLEAQLHAHGAIEVQRHLEKGTFFRLRMESGWAKKLRLEKFRT